MSGAFLGLLILLCITGLAIIESILHYIGQFLYIIISIIIYTFKNKHNKKEEKAALYEKVAEKKWTYVSSKPANWNTNDFNIEKEKFYCERCFRRISEDEYEMNDCMCEDCYTDINYYGEDF